MDPTNVQNLRKFSNANVLQIFAFVLQMWVTIWAGKPDDKGNIFTMWQEFRSQCVGQKQMNTLNCASVFNSVKQLFWILAQKEKKILTEIERLKEIPLKPDLANCPFSKAGA